jgi:hypothetical protein
MKSEISSTRCVVVLCACLAWACKAGTEDSYFDENVPGGDGGGHTGDGGDDGGGTDTSTGDGATGDDGGTDESDDGGGTGDGGTGDTNTLPDVNECGDGILGNQEACDGDLFGNETCQSQGWESGELVCNEFCTGYSTDGCYTCGNAVVEGPETCDGGVGNATCEDQGFTEGEVTCNVETCELDTSGCTLCGDGTVEGNEECDTDDLNAATCESLGYIEGTLACGEDCAFDKTACISDDYTQDFESGSLGPEWTTSGSANWFASTTTPINGSYSAESGNIIDSQYTELSLTLDYNADGDISFWHKESCEAGWDYHYFYIDNVLQGSWSGIYAATEATYPVTAGTHTFRWRYEKDVILDGGTDTVWIDDIYATGGKVP